jgi:peptidoglycan/xylan/chitin deacetylase (PgdA/CDA1 family)
MTRGPRFRQAPILMYHRLTDQTGSHPCSLAADHFRRQLALLRALGYRSVDPGALTDGGRHARAVAITFDDGYADTLTVALPLLVEFGFRATCYAVADAIGGSSLWTAPAPLMDWAGLRAWHSAGMAVGAHTRTHPDLTRLAGRPLREEVAGARARLEDGLGAEVRSFAYPFNRLDARAIEAVAAAGYTDAVAGPEVHGSPWALCRVDGARASWSRFALGLWPRFPALRGLCRAVVPA